MKISEYKLNKFNPNSCGELITTVQCKHYKFVCNGEVLTCNGELGNNYIVQSKIKMICKWRDKKKNNRTTNIYDSIIKEINDEDIENFIEFCFKTIYKNYEMS